VGLSAKESGPGVQAKTIVPIAGDRGFESVSLQQTVSVSTEFASRRHKARVFRGCAARNGGRGRQRRAGRGDVAPKAVNISAEPYSGTAAPGAIATVAALANRGLPRDSAMPMLFLVGIGSGKAEHGPLLVPGQRQTRVRQ
jgi:hypothetical protein